MKVYEAIAEIVIREGVDAVFAVMGDGNMKWLAEFTKRSGRAVFFARHEASAVAMADGYARSTGKIAVCSVTCGPGLSLTATTMVASSRASAPLLLIVGDSPVQDKYYEQAFDQRRFVEACETMSESLRSPATLDDDLRDSFYLARTVGPTVFSAAFDVQEEEVDPGGRAYLPSTALIASEQEIRPDPSAVAEASKIIGRAARPIIIAGHGAIDAKGAVLRLADATGALLATSLRAKGLFDGHPRDIGVAGGFSVDTTRAYFGEADCVIAVGASLNHYTTDDGQLFASARVVHITPERLALIDGRRRTNGRPGGKRLADCYVQGAARPTLDAILTELASVDSSHGRPRESWVDPLRPDAPLPISGDSHLHPASVMAELNVVADQHSRFVVGMGHQWWFPIAYLRDRWDPDAFLTVSEFGAIGQGLPTAIGSAVGRRDRKHVVIEGDAGVLMAIQELDTAVRYGIDLVVLVMNDRGLGAEAIKLAAAGFDPTPARIDSPDLAAIARSLGGDGVTVRSLPALRDALVQFQAGGGVALIDVQISQRVVSAPYARAIAARES